MSGQTRLQTELGSTSAQSFSVHDASGKTICDDLLLAAGTLLKPCVADTSPPDPAYAQAAKATQGMQRQVVQFVERHVVCDPNPAVTCP